MGARMQSLTILSGLSLQVLWICELRLKKSFGLGEFPVFMAVEWRHFLKELPLCVNFLDKLVFLNVPLSGKQQKFDPLSRKEDLSSKSVERRQRCWRFLRAATQSRDLLENSQS